MTASGDRGVLLYFVVPFALVSLVMVYAMVQWSRALLETAPTPARARRRRGWGVAYGGCWIALLALLTGLFAIQERTLSGRNAAVVSLVVGGWWGLHALLVWSGRAIARAQAGTATRRAEPEPRAGEDGEVTAPTTSPAPAPRAGSGPVRRAAGWVASVALVLVVIALGEASPLMQALEQAVAEREALWLGAAITLAVVGFVLLMGGAIHMEVAGGGSGHDEVAFAEVKAAWRARAWRSSARGRRFFLMGTGALLMTAGIFGIPFVLGGPGMKLVVLAVWAFVLVQLVRGFRRA